MVALMTELTSKIMLADYISSIKAFPHGMRKAQAADGKPIHCVCATAAQTRPGSARHSTRRLSQTQLERHALCSTLRCAWKTPHPM